MHVPLETHMSFVSPPTDLQTVVDSEVKEWHFHIYFHQNNSDEHAAALALRDAILSLRRDGAFVAVPLWRVNLGPMGPHPAGSYEIWCPSESFASVFSYICQNHGNLSVLVHPLTKEETLYASPFLASLSCEKTIVFSDHDPRTAWIGQKWPIDLAALSVRLPDIPLQYASLKMGYSSETPQPSLTERQHQGAQVEKTLKGEKDAARAPAN